jgi:hypothetical protein
VILWLNGTFGVGKTTTALLIRELAPEWRLFDPEYVGFMLQANLAGLDFSDFQELPPWRTLVPQVAHELISLTGDSLLTVQSVLVQEYWDELKSGFGDRRLEVFHVLLDAPSDLLRERIIGDQIEGKAERWRLDHIATYESAKKWLSSSADLVVDTSRLSAMESDSYILESLR